MANDDHPFFFGISCVVARLFDPQRYRPRPLLLPRITLTISFLAKSSVSEAAAAAFQ